MIEIAVGVGLTLHCCFLIINRQRLRYKKAAMLILESASLSYPSHAIQKERLIEARFPTVPHETNH
jgi:hypothetical protein